MAFLTGLSFTLFSFSREGRGNNFFLGGKKTVICPKIEERRRK